VECTFQGSFQCSGIERSDFKSCHFVQGVFRLSALRELKGHRFAEGARLELKETVLTDCIFVGAKLTGDGDVVVRGGKLSKSLEIDGHGVRFTEAAFESCKVSTTVEQIRARI